PEPGDRLVVLGGAVLLARVDVSDMRGDADGRVGVDRVDERRCGQELGVVCRCRTVRRVTVDGKCERTRISRLSGRGGKRGERREGGGRPGGEQRSTHVQVGPLCPTSVGPSGGPYLLRSTTKGRPAVSRLSRNTTPQVGWVAVTCSGDNCRALDLRHRPPPRRRRSPQLGVAGG